MPRVTVEGTVMDIFETEKNGKINKTATIYQRGQREMLSVYGVNGVETGEVFKGECNIYATMFNGRAQLNCSVIKE